MDAGSSSCVQTLQTVDHEGKTHTANITGTTVIFDSFSTEEEVGRRNLAANTISQLNSPERHFPVSFDVSIQAKAAAVLSAYTVSSYCVVDRRSSKQIEGKRERKLSRPPAAKMTCEQVLVSSTVSETERIMHNLKKRCLERGHWDGQPSPIMDAVSSLETNRALYRSHMMPEHISSTESVRVCATPLKDVMSVSDLSDEQIAVSALRDMMTLPNGCAWRTCGDLEHGQRF